MTTIPPPPTYPPTIGPAAVEEPEAVGLTKTTNAETEPAPTAAEPLDWNAIADRLGHTIGTLISETSEEREARIQADREARYAAAGETDSQRKARHKREAIARKRKASALRHQDGTERAKRFRRWCIVTAMSASAGYAVGLVQLVAHLPLPVGTAALIGGWALDLRVRGLVIDRRGQGRGPTRVTAVRGAAPLILLTIARIPVASALTGVLHADALLNVVHLSH
ncbi:hypothetical protein KV557_10020 [Kitasatospora aureofaciens]|uniref:hypothetical protein n=1 Tax=Kitasatospora aureofaciens TaxID=1894 RepID=UPI001C49520A|nr:hypothetical protein [Kitasatospora aureofaciens]MBV6697460.1 hypothetical protein [Kitasatospora aureofaciens]